jgi:serine/threonine protein kinase
MEKTEFIDFQTIRSSIKFENPDYFIIYLNEVYHDLLERMENKGGLTKIAFYEYLKIPLFISDKLFASFDKDDDGLLNIKEFANGLYQLYQGNFEETAQIIFNIFDFNKDGIVYKCDVKILLSYLPLKEEYNSCHKKQIESLGELDDILNASFKGETSINFTKFINIIETVKSDIYLQLICFLYQNKPFEAGKINLFKNHKKKRSWSYHIPKKIDTSKQRLISPDKNARIKCYDNFCFKLTLSKTDSENSNSPEKKSIISNTASLKRDNSNNLLVTKDSPENRPKGVLKKLMQSPEKNKTPIQQRNSLVKGSVTPTRKVSYDKVTLNSSPIKSRASVDMVRMANQKIAAKKKEDGGSGGYSNGSTNNHINDILNTSKSYFNSPTKILRGSNGNVEPFLLDDNFKMIDHTGLSSEQVTHEDTIWLLDTSGKKVKKYYMVLIMNEISVYDIVLRDELILFHNLSGCFVKTGNGEKIFDKDKYKSFSIILSKTISKEFYVQGDEAYNTWVEKIKKAIGYQSFEEIYDIQKDIGEGKFGSVKLGIHKTTGQKVAVKVIKKEPMDPQDVELIKTEIDLMKLFRHPNLVKLLDHFENNDYIYIVMEFLSGGDMLSYIKEKQVLKESRAAKIIYNIALGVSYLNSYGIVHRDLKPENLMLIDSSENSSVKIIDFGLTKTVAPGEKMKESLGTINYVAPEVLTKKPYGKQIDIWSMGIILYLMLAGFLPFDDQSSLDQKIIEKTIHMEPSYPEEIFGKVSKGAVRLINQCLVKDPEKRITIEEFLKNDWLRKNI